eukprot:CAMPEP_0197188312 /NCGR_PEP_ID=MMETSP1423-20130617/17592_1 /TAXON_ID=476441 /ORGANISM="Pseudo-nitzschia heimii, Strain UNC1101" /LENGTH=986 /DNA_ID=CAMNT_0042640113 /DNA_START=112 /DNA_END=3072 /DNA_ORIENTATION=+
MATNKNDDNGAEMVVSLTDPSVGADRVRPSRVGGKSSSLAKLFATEGLGSRVPSANALTVDFFAPWVEELVRGDDFQALSRGIAAASESGDIAATAICERLQASSLKLTLTEGQSEALSHLVGAMKGKLAAVRSSAPEEDGSGASFAGAFETKLAVETSFAGLEEAVKECFASLWDYRVLLYKQKQQQHVPDGSGNNIGFAVTVMEMIDSVIAGVAFSANPLNSDRDEIVIDSSWGLGESVVDGSVTADRYIVDKIERKTIEENIGKKGNEKRIGSGGVVNKTIDEKDPRYSKSSLDSKKIEALTDLVCLIEETYGMPMDIEWAFVVDDEAGSSELVPKLLQARPITTLFPIDPAMMTKPGEKRRLYFDINVVSEATTTTPFTTLDIDVYNGITNALMFGKAFGEAEAEGCLFYSETNPDCPIYWGQTRQYVNLGYALRYSSEEKIAKFVESLDAYVTSLIRSKDCDVKKYRTTYWLPKGYTLKPIWGAYSQHKSMLVRVKGHKKDPKGAMQNYLTEVKTSIQQLRKIIEQGFDFDGSVGVHDIACKLANSVKPYLTEECGLIMEYVMPLFRELDEKRQNGETKEVREDHDDLGGGFEGDPLMEMNIALYQLAQRFPKSLWEEYNHKNGMAALADRIREERDLPEEFLREWKSFMKMYGFDGQDQLFVSCPRYNDAPELLLEKMRINTGGNVKDPSEILKEKLEKRRLVMSKHEEAAKYEAERAPFWKKNRMKKKLAAVQHRNFVLDDIVWVRNAPKIHLTEVAGAIRIFVLKAEEKLIAEGRLEEKGDIFHLKIGEIDRALLANGDPIDLMELVRPRKAFYQRAVASDMCPLLVDSRGRILKPDPPPPSDDPNTLVGAAISPGVATGTVRIIRDLSPGSTEGFGIGPDGNAEDHVLCAVVTGPAWTPLFASAAAVVLQIGGVLQHGALCAREYGKPAVSNIDVLTQLKDGMRVLVDGDTGIVRILREDGVDVDDDDNNENTVEEC